MTETQPIPDLRVQYRPRRFDQLAQGLADPTIRAVTTSLSRRCMIQALLLQGPYGSGKTSLARILGTRAACERQELHPYEPCGDCANCRAVRSDPRSASREGYLELDSQRRSPKELIDYIMDVIPYNKTGGRIMPQTVVCLDEFHRLALKDQEKLVKVIEDGSARWKTMFLLCVAPDAKICPAIRQRSSSRPLRLPTLAQCAKHLRHIADAEGFALMPADAELIAAAAGFVPRVYVDRLQDAMLFSLNQRISREAVLLACDLIDSPQMESKINEPLINRGL